MRPLFLPTTTEPWPDLTVPIKVTKEWFFLPKILPKGKNHAVLYPGLATPAASLALLHLALQSKGIVCHEWEQGFNTGITAEVERKALNHLLELMQQHPDAKWHLIGWSLGGVLARELAKKLTSVGQQCTSVVTMGTPVNKVPDNPKLLAIYKLFNKDNIPQEDIFFKQRLYVSPPCRTLSIYSRQDSVVPWKSCIQSPMHKGNDVAINSEVNPGHLTMINHPATWTMLVRWINNSYAFELPTYQKEAEQETVDYWVGRNQTVSH